MFAANNSAGGDLKVWTFVALDRDDPLRAQRLSLWKYVKANPRALVSAVRATEHTAMIMPWHDE